MDNISHSKRGAGLNRMTKMAYENIKSQSQLKGCAKNVFIGFPDIPLMVINWKGGGPGSKKRIEYAATISKRKSVVWPLMVRVTWVLCGAIVMGAKVGRPRPLRS